MVCSALLDILAPHFSYLDENFSGSLATMKVPEETLKEIFNAIDDRQNEFVANLKEAVSIPSVSSEPARRPDCVNMVMWAKKGPVIAWIHAISVLQKKGVDIPVNLKFVFECMEESGSEGLEQALRNHKDDFLKNVDMTCISDNYWLGKNKPCLTYGLSPEAMNDLVWIMSQLTDVDGKIKIPGIYDLVAPLTDEEKKCYDTIDFCMDTFQNDVAACGLLKNSKHEILMNRWRYPSLSLHGIEGAFSSSGAKTVIPSKVVGKFSIRIVPNMTPEAVDKLVVTHLNDLWSKRHSPNHFNAFPHHSGMPWVTDWKHENFAAGSRAIKKVFGVEPDYTREGGSIPITLVFQELTGNNVMLLPIGACDDMAHSQNEKLDRVNYIQGTKMMAAYLLELAA
ncbi:peptidase, M20/M25/M40 family [Teladorsagia circumcincta]|uniref:Peptidase, M20/M25/M40 family n=1 Tax=Teladorsagia circumcincta TaxID=45464 RepID=A0A2G9V4Z0_TELCI|nr:peptidase, M20/M25/M40 family [Teladorsagia circumcincta]